MQTWSVTIILDAFERRKRNTGLLHLFTGFLLIIKTMDWARKATPDKHWISFLLLTAGLLFLLFGLWGKRITPSFTTWSKRFFLAETGCFLWLSLLFIPAGRPVDLMFTIVWTLLCGFFYHSEEKTEKPAVVRLRENGILIPGMLKDILLPWQKVESVVLRNDYLTINKKNNKYYQFEIAEENGESYIAAFNRYAEGKIK